MPCPVLSGRTIDGFITEFKWHNFYCKERVRSRHDNHLPDGHPLPYRREMRPKRFTHSPIPQFKNLFT